MALGGAGRRNKGKRGEREVIDKLQPVVNEVYAAHGLPPPLLQRNTLQSDKGGYDIVGIPWLALEVKLCETYALAAWWQQAVRQAGSGQVPVLLYRRSRVPWQAMLHVSAAPGCRCEATISWPAFVRWFRVTLTQEIQHELE